jgi:hypothetical protein
MDPHQPSRRDVGTGGPSSVIAPGSPECNQLQRHPTGDDRGGLIDPLVVQLVGRL